MRFSLFRIIDSQAYKGILNIKPIYLSSDEELSIFHQNKLENGLLHVVYNINDEYRVGTKKVGSQYNLPISTYINTFYHVNSSLLFVEDQNDIYTREILNYLKSKNIESENIELTNAFITKIIKNNNAHIKKLEYKNSEDEDIYLGPTPIDTFTKIVGENSIIDYVSLIIKQSFVSLHTKGIISIDSNNQEYLTNFLKELADEFANVI